MPVICTFAERMAQALASGPRSGLVLAATSRHFCLSARLQEEDKWRRAGLRQEAQKLGLGSMGSRDPITRRLQHVSEELVIMIYQLEARRSRGSSSPSSPPASQPSSSTSCCSGGSPPFTMSTANLTREENDWDMNVGREEWFNAVRGQEEWDLERSIRHHEELGIDSRELRARLAEIRGTSGDPLDKHPEELGI